MQVRYSERNQVQSLYRLNKSRKARYPLRIGSSICRSLAGIFLVCAVILSGTAAAQEKPQTPISPFQDYLGDCSLFESLTPEHFLSAKSPARPFFQWTSDEKQEARYPGYSNSPKLTFYQFEPPEVKMFFDGQRLDRIYLSIYNRGDRGEIDQSRFQTMIGELDAVLSEATGAKGTEQKSKLTAKAVNKQKVWIRDNKYAYILRWSTSGKGKSFLSEYIQLVIEPFDPKKDPRKELGTSMDKKDVKKGSTLLSNVKKEEDGTVFIDHIPMVDQGQKMYCAVAVCERIMRYYGNEEVTQHTLAQIAQSGEAGTNSENMLLALRRIGTKFGLRVRELYTGPVDSVKDVERTISKYNSMAKKMKKPKINMIVRDRVVYVQETIAQMDHEILRAMRLSEKSDLKKFQSNLKEYVNKGIPVIWRVTLGIVKEPNLPQQSSGHMRLLIGYNEKTKEVVFSDTWGAGHEKKMMSLEDAWVITNGTILLEPRK